eukprot:scaffold11_cov257-Pinguiococcus_pyrenoidosus.AAC.14
MRRGVYEAGYRTVGNATRKKRANLVRHVDQCYHFVAVELDIPLAEENLQRGPDAQHLELAPEAALLTADAVHNAADVLELLLQLNLGNNGQEQLKGA